MTSAKECADIVREEIDALNAHDLDRFTQHHAERCETLTVPTGERAFGPSGARENMSRWFAAFPDLSFEILELLSGEDFSVLEVVCRGTHRGALAFPDGEWPATGNSVETRVCVVTRFRDGEAIEERDYFDLAGMMEQLSASVAVPPSEEGARGQMGA